MYDNIVQSFEVRKCSWCGGNIPAGEFHQRITDIYEGQEQTRYYHGECIMRAQRRERQRVTLNFMDTGGVSDYIKWCVRLEEMGCQETEGCHTYFKAE